MQYLSNPSSTTRKFRGLYWASLGLAGALALGLSTPAWAGQGVFQAVNLHAFGNPEAERAGAATLMRMPNQVSANIRASDLDPDSAYTAWWVVFNNPAACASIPCTGADLRNPAVKGANFYATGFISDSTGTANISAELKAGRLAEGIEAIDFDTGVKPKLKRGKGMSAEIHLVLRTHGPVMPGWTAEQISSGEFGACEPCANQQAAVFLPVQ